MKKLNITAYQGGTTEYISRNDLLTVINADVAEAHNERCAQLLEAIINAPIAEVVPKEHYDVLEDLVRRLEKAIGEKETKIQELLLQACAVEAKFVEETAAAIFAEIDRLVLLHKSGHYILSDTFCEGIAELKKAFLEGEDAKADDVCD